MQGAVRVLIVENHQLMRNGLHTLVSSNPAFEVVAAIADTGDALRTGLALAPHVVLMAPDQSRAEGLGTITRIKAQHPEIKIVALTFRREDYYVLAALEAGADGYVLKDDCRAEILNALGSVASGTSYLSDGLRDTASNRSLAGTGTIPNN